MGEEGRSTEVCLFGYLQSVFRINYLLLEIDPVHGVHGLVRDIVIETSYG